GPQVPVRVKGQAIRSAARLHKSRQLALDAPFQNPIVGLIGEEDITFSVAGWTFSEGEIAGQFLQHCSWGDDFALGGYEARGAKKTQESRSECFHKVRCFSGVASGISPDVAGGVRPPGLLIAATPPAGKRAHSVHSRFDPPGRMPGSPAGGTPAATV